MIRKNSELPRGFKLMMESGLYELWVGIVLFFTGVSRAYSLGKLGFSHIDEIGWFVAIFIYMICLYRFVKPRLTDKSKQMYTGIWNWEFILGLVFGVLVLVILLSMMFKVNLYIHFNPKYSINLIVILLLLYAMILGLGTRTFRVVIYSQVFLLIYIMRISRTGMEYFRHLVYLLGLSILISGVFHYTAFLRKHPLPIREK